MAKTATTLQQTQDRCLCGRAMTNRAGQRIVPRVLLEGDITQRGFTAIKVMTCVNNCGHTQERRRHFGAQREQVRLDKTGFLPPALILPASKLNPDRPQKVVARSTSYVSETPTHAGGGGTEDNILPYAVPKGDFDTRIKKSAKLKPSVKKSAVKKLTKAKATKVVAKKGSK